MSGEVEAIIEAFDVGEKLIESGLEFIRAQKEGNAEAERAALLKAARVSSDEIARREANE